MKDWSKITRKGEKKKVMREWTLEELQSREHDFADQLFRLKFQFSSGQSETLGKIRELRKDLARVKTLLREVRPEAADEKKT